MKNYTLVLLFLFSFGTVTQVFAQETEITAENTDTTGENAEATSDEQTKTPAELELQTALAIENAAERATAVAVAKMDEEGKRQFEEGTSEFAGINFGVGISLTFDLGDDSRVEDASIVDGIVRVNNENDKIARVMLESHYFFVPGGRFLKMNSLHSGRWGWGPFVALQPGTDEIIEAISVGLMVGFRRPNETGASWNVGIGYITDPNVDVLGDGFVENQPPPGNETEVRLKEISQDGIVLLFSFSF